MTDTTSKTTNEEKFTFFYITKSSFSQFHPCSFKGTPLFNNAIEHTFNSCEQWMMFNKALLFDDLKIAQDIMNAGQDPMKIKSLGRKVKNFDDEIWQKHNVNIIYQGNKLKFSQNRDLLRNLQSTVGTTLVEASPTDRIYGIGLSENDPRALNRITWRGKNLLGETLTKLREELKL